MRLVVWVNSFLICREVHEENWPGFRFPALVLREKDCPEARDNSQFPPLVERWQSGLTRTPGKRE
jgi:hypothetical protein